MAKSKSTRKLTLSASRDIPFNRLVLSQANVRRVKAGVSIEALAEDIARRTLLQSLTVRAVLDERGAETGVYEVPAGGRRFRALQLLVKQKRLAPALLDLYADDAMTLEQLMAFTVNGDHQRQGDLDYWVVSDASPETMERFVAAFRNHL